MNRFFNRQFVTAALVVVSASGGFACASDTYNFALTSQSSLTSNFSASAPFTGSFIGTYNSQSNPGGTRTLPGAIGSCSGTGNQAISFSGTGTATGNPTTTPTGTFGITFDTTANTATLSGLNINLLGTATPAVTPNATLTYQAFHTCQPTGFFPSIPIPLDLGEATVNTLTAMQTCSPRTGTLTHTTGNTYTFSITLNVTLNVSFTFSGVEQIATPSEVPITLTGTAVLSGSTATANASITIMQHEVTPGPIPALVNSPFDLPNPLGGTVHLLLTLTLTSSTVDLNGTAAIAASGTLGPAPCRGDWNHDSQLNSQDFFDFLVAFFANAADFNCSGSTDSQDFFDFLTAFFTGC